MNDIQRKLKKPSETSTNPKVTKSFFTVGNAEATSLMGLQPALTRKRPQRGGIQQETTWGRRKAV